MTSPSTLADGDAIRSAGRSVPLQAAMVIGGSALMAAAAHVQVPFWPVSLSMQSFVVIMIGMTMGSRLGAATILAYIMQGAVGLPVFQGGAGLPYLAGPTGGYLLGFVLAAAVVGFLSERGALDRWPTAMLSIVAGIAALYAPGVAWLAILFGAEKSIAYGLTPFIAGEVLKIGLALALVPAIRRFAR